MDRTRRRGELTSARTADGDEAAGGWWTAHGDEGDWKFWQPDGVDLAPSVLR